jgi:cell division protein FtsZ
MKNPMLLVGIGGAGSKIATAASAALECKCLLISNDKKDLIHNDRCTGVFVGCGEWINPSSYKLRSFVQAHRNEIAAAMSGYQTVLVISNLGGRAGTAIAPIVCRMAKDSSDGTAVISMAIMPFRYEHDRIFNAGTALRRLREVSDSTIVMDNDAFLDNNPELSQEECFNITNSAMVEITSSISKGMLRPAMNVLCTSKTNPNPESSLRDSLAMLYGAIPDASAIKTAIIYVIGGGRVAIGELNKMVSCIRGVFREDHAIDVGMMSSIPSSDGVRVHLVATAPQKTRFDRYDPIGEIIPDALDWDEPDSAPDIRLAIPAIE